MADSRSYEAIVEKVVPDGLNGPYAVARSSELGVITFALTKEVWSEDEWPDSGVTVVLSKVRKTRAGWRAKNGRFFEPSDQQ